MKPPDSSDIMVVCLDNNWPTIEKQMALLSIMGQVLAFLFGVSANSLFQRYRGGLVVLGGGWVVGAVINSIIVTDA